MKFLQSCLALQQTLDEAADATDAGAQSWMAGRVFSAPGERLPLLV